LRIAIKRAKAIKLIQENNFENERSNFHLDRKRKNREDNFYEKEKKRDENFEKKNKEKEKKSRNKFHKHRSGKFEKNKFNVRAGNENGKECWECGKVDYFRSECPGRMENKEYSSLARRVRVEGRQSRKMLIILIIKISIYLFQDK